MSIGRLGWDGTGRGRWTGRLLACLLCLLCASGSALAERGFDRPGNLRNFDRSMLPNREQRFADREALREERRQRRMSEEQRLQLRRDIDEAGRDLYRRPRRFRDQ